MVWSACILCNCKRSSESANYRKFAYHEETSKIKRKHPLRLSLSPTLSHLDWCSLLLHRFEGTAVRFQIGYRIQLSNNLSDCQLYMQHWSKVSFQMPPWVSNPDLFQSGNRKDTAGQSAFVHVHLLNGRWYVALSYWNEPCEIKS